MPDPDEPTVQPFSAYLVSTNKGRTHSELSEGLHELTAEVLRTGKKGSITLTVTVDADDAEAHRLTVSELVNVKLPKPTARKSVFWADADGNLARTDPQQMNFGDLRAADVTVNAPSDERKSS